MLSTLTVLSIYLTSKISQIKTQYSLDQFQPTSSPILTEDQKIKDTFHLHGQMPIIADLKTNKGHWLTKKRLNALSKVSQRLRKVDGVHDVTSLATVDTAIPDQGSFYVGSLEEVALGAHERQQVLQNPLLVPHLLSKDGKHASLLIELKRLTFDQQRETLQKIENILSGQPSFFTAQIGGPAAITVAMSQLVSKEVVICTLISLLVSILFFFILFKNISVLIASSIVVLYSNIIGLGMLWVFDLKLTVLTSTLPTLITLTVVAISVQTFSRVALYRHKVIEKHKHLMAIKIVSGVVGSSFLAALTTAIGFATLITSDTPVMREYGISVSMAIMIASMTSIALLSSMLVWMPVPHKRKMTFPVEKFFSYFFVYKKPFLVSMAAISVFLLIFGTHLNWSARLFDDLPAQEKAIQATHSMEKTYGGVLPMDVMITSKTPGYWKQQANIQKLDTLKKEFKKMDGVGSIISVTDFFKLASPSRRLPASNGAVSETYFVYSMAQENPLDYFVNPNHTSTRISLKLHDIPSDKNEELVSHFAARAQELFPDAEITKGGIAATVHPLNKSLSIELIVGALVALVAIFILLMIVFRSVRWSIVAMIPNLFTPLALIGIIGLTNTPIKPTLAIVFAISLGISFDNTIYVLHKLRKLLAQRGNTRVLPILSLMREELMPCLVSSAALISGFTAFLFSNFSINKTFGMFMILSLTAGLISDLVLLPVLLHFAPGLLLKPINVVKIKQTLGAYFMKPSTQRHLTVFALLATVFLLTESTFAKPSGATDLLKKIAKKNSTPSEEAKIRMKIVEADGSSKERVLVIKKKSKKDQMALVRLMSPSDLKGVGLLMVAKGSSENQWLYLPSEKRSRRIVGSNRNGRFLDSEISYEDLRIATYENFNNKVTADPQSGNKDILLIESTAKSKNDSSYGKIKTWVDTKQERLLKTEFYDTQGELLKVMTFDNYKKFANVWRAQSINVKNVKKNRSTVLQLEKLSTKNLDDDEFSIDSLEEG